MKSPILYRKRLIPDECILLKDDLLIHRDDHIIITKWDTLRPKKTLHHGLSCYFLKDGIKLSKFYDQKNRLICWYCDIITYEYDPSTDTYIFTDLLADVIVYPDGAVHVVDLDELSDAAEKKLLSQEYLLLALRQLNQLLQTIYTNHFDRMQAYLDSWTEENC